MAEAMLLVPQLSPFGGSLALIIDFQKNMLKAIGGWTRRDQVIRCLMRAANTPAVPIVDGVGEQPFVGHH